MAGWFDDLFDIFSGRNLVTPLVAAVRDIQEGGDVVHVRANGAGSRRAVRDYLKQNGIDCHGDLYAHGSTVQVTVKGDDGQRVAQLFRAKGWMK